MFDNIGSKIKGLATIISFIGIGASIVIGLSLLFNGGGAVSVIIALIGALFSWLSSFFMYGFGQLIENSDEAVRILKATNNQQPQPTETFTSVDTSADSHLQQIALPPQEHTEEIISDGKIYKCQKCGARMNRPYATCVFCNAEHSFIEVNE